jgi:nitrate reductase gamma subunit
MNLANDLAFVVYPYLCLAVFVLGHGYRYVTDRYGWNARSSEFLEKRHLFYGSTLFHWGILLTLLGHCGGLLIPQRIFDAVGINGETHTAIAYYSGLLVGSLAFVGSFWLLGRRVGNARIRAVDRVNDTVTLAALTLVVGAGLYNVIFGHFYVLDTVAPWIRSILTFAPNPDPMLIVPMSYKIHILSALALLAFSPFSRLVHIWSAPIFYLFRPPILFRRAANHADRGEL